VCALGRQLDGKKEYGGRIAGLCKMVCGEEEKWKDATAQMKMASVYIAPYPTEARNTNAFR
jgi:hypothetical protein